MLAQVIRDYTLSKTEAEVHEYFKSKRLRDKKIKNLQLFTPPP